MDKKVINKQIQSVPKFSLFPLPVVLVSSANSNGNTNICTVSWIGIISTKPFNIGIGLRKERLSYKYIVQTNEFCINIPSQEMLFQVDYCGNYSGRTKDKFHDCNFIKNEGNKTTTPLIDNCLINYECKVVNILELGSHHLIIGEVVETHVRQGVLNNDGRINVTKIMPILLCDNEYWSVGTPLGKIGLSKSKK